MRFPILYEVRPLVDDEVDRFEVEVQQWMELTNTNRSRAYPQQSLTHVVSQYALSFVSHLVFRELSLNFKKNRFNSFNRTDILLKQKSSLVMMAEGIHAFPSRTRPLSPPAPMVLEPQGSGRVGHCQAIDSKKLTTLMVSFFFVTKTKFLVCIIPDRGGSIESYYSLKGGVYVWSINCHFWYTCFCSYASLC